jgi:hypothetical protein
MNGDLEGAGFVPSQCGRLPHLLVQPLAVEPRGRSPRS